MSFLTVYRSEVVCVVASLLLTVTILRDHIPDCSAGAMGGAVLDHLYLLICFFFPCHAYLPCADSTEIVMHAGQSVEMAYVPEACPVYSPLLKELYHAAYAGNPVAYLNEVFESTIDEINYDSCLSSLGGSLSGSSESLKEKEYSEWTGLSLLGPKESASALLPLELSPPTREEDTVKSIESQEGANQLFLAFNCDGRALYEYSVLDSTFLKCEFKWDEAFFVSDIFWLEDQNVEQRVFFRRLLNVRVTTLEDSLMVVVEVASVPFLQLIYISSQDFRSLNILERTDLADFISKHTTLQTVELQVPAVNSFCMDLSSNFNHNGKLSLRLRSVISWNDQLPTISRDIDPSINHVTFNRPYVTLLYNAETNKILFVLKDSGKSGKCLDMTERFFRSPPIQRIIQ